jgi:pyridoxamine 5'-phosphate oxidase
VFSSAWETPAGDARRDLGLSRDPRGATVLVTDPAEDPIAEFGDWLERAVEAGLPEPTAATLATATPAGRPSARIVLLKSVDSRGFVFATNYRSRKGREIDANPWGCLVFYWHALERQVRVEGRIETASAAESDGIFAARPRAAQLGAWASRQSDILPDRAALEHAMQDAAARFPGTVPRPPHWGAYRMVPDAIELWIGRPHRLHDRARYERRTDGAWNVHRLAP